MTTSDWILIVNGIAIVLAPIVALGVGGILQRRSDVNKTKLTVFGTLIALRHDPLSVESTRALNLIDAAFADNSRVREAWTRYYTVLNDQSMNAAPGYSIREGEKTRPPPGDGEGAGIISKGSPRQTSYEPTFRLLLPRPRTSRSWSAYRRGLLLRRILRGGKSLIRNGQPRRKQALPHPRPPSRAALQLETGSGPALNPNRWRAFGAASN